MAFISEILTDLRRIKQDSKNMRIFGILLTMLLLTFGSIIWYKHRMDSDAIPVGTIAFICLSFLSLIISFASPMLLKPLNTGMIFISMIIGWIMTRLILTIVFMLIMVPISYFLRVSGKDALRRSYDPKTKSYWLPRKEIVYNKERSRRLF